MTSLSCPETALCFQFRASSIKRSRTRRLRVGSMKANNTHTKRRSPLGSLEFAHRKLDSRFFLLRFFTTLAFRKKRTIKNQEPLSCGNPREPCRDVAWCDCCASRTQDAVAFVSNLHLMQLNRLQQVKAKNIAMVPVYHVSRSQVGDQ